ncbi:MAG TPA: LlsX family protein [Firmicutes bacterium]|nr:LlsX family protein [Bacillales bacterium]HJA40437.1 LlsX family protein [Bacillota bacterium]
MKKKAEMVLALIIGFAVAMILMSVAIYFGYSNAYRLDVERYTVKLLGISIYELTRIGTEYVGAAIGKHMGLICGIFMALSFTIDMVIRKLFILHKKQS